MNARELFNWWGASAGIFFCSECRSVKRTGCEAEECCRPYVCKCGVELPRKEYRLTCRACEEKKEAAKELAKFEAAEKIDESVYDGWVYDGDEYYGDIDAWREHFEEEVRFSDEVEAPIPDYVWACFPHQLVSVSLREILGGIEDNAELEEFEAGDECKGTEELEKALEAFNEANKELQSYSPDYKMAVMVDKSKFENEEQYHE